MTEPFDAEEKARELRRLLANRSHQRKHELTMAALREAYDAGRASRDGLAAALAEAEAALSDIGDATREPGDDLAWCENRAAGTLPRVRGALIADAAPWEGADG